MLDLENHQPREKTALLLLLYFFPYFAPKPFTASLCLILHLPAFTLFPFYPTPCISPGH